MYILERARIRFVRTIWSIMSEDVIAGKIEYNKIWFLVGRILDEKWSFIDGDFKDMSISGNLLRDICRSLGER